MTKKGSTIIIYYSRLTDDQNRDDNSAHRIKNTQMKTAALKSQLKQMLAKPVLAVAGVSKSYITGGSHPIVDSLIAEDGCESSRVARIRFLIHYSVQITKK